MAQVQLWVYDLSGGMAKAFSRMLLDKQVDGVWHTSVVLRGTEYYFGHGINAAAPGTTPCGTPVQILDLGTTQLDEDTVRAVLVDLSERYTPQSYSLFSNNCNNFSDEFARLLTGCGVPEHITGLPAEVLATPFGRMLAPALKGLEAQLGRMGTPAVGPAAGRAGGSGTSAGAAPAAPGRGAAQILGAQLAAALAGASAPTPAAPLGSGTAAPGPGAPAEPVSPRTLSRDLDAAIAHAMIAERQAGGQATAAAGDDRAVTEEHVAAETARLMSDAGGGLDETEAAAQALQHEAHAREAADA